jgi:hypothetical protein
LGTFASKTPTTLSSNNGCTYAIKPPPSGTAVLDR